MNGALSNVGMPHRFRVSPGTKPHSLLLQIVPQTLRMKLKEYFRAAIISVLLAGGAFVCLRYEIRALRHARIERITASAPVPSVPNYLDHHSLLVYADVHGQMHPVKSLDDWGKRREDILKEMEEVMGVLPSS